MLSLLNEGANNIYYAAPKQLEAYFNHVSFADPIKKMVGKKQNKLVSRIWNYEYESVGGDELTIPFNVSLMEWKHVNQTLFVKR